MLNGLTRQAFEPVPLETTYESCLYAWRRAIHLLFDPTKGYVTSSAYLEPENGRGRDGLDRSVYYIVRAGGHPVFFVEVNPFGHQNSISTRDAADQHMRERFSDLKENLKIGRLYGISCMGPQFGVWSMDSHTGEMSPRPIQRSMTHVTDTAPRSWWTHSVVEDSGHQRLETLARNVYDMVATTNMPRELSSHARLPSEPVVQQREEVRTRQPLPPANVITNEQDVQYYRPGPAMWNGLTRQAFELLPLETTHESCLYAWRRAIHLLFDPAQGFEISPPHLEQEHEGINSSMYYIVRAGGHPVFVIETNPSGHLNTISTRAAADQHVRQRFTDLKEELIIGRLYGVSCMGPQFGIWSMDARTGEMSPRPIQRSMTHIMDSAPRSWWTQSVLEDAGHERLTDIAQNVYDMIATTNMPWVSRRQADPPSAPAIEERTVRPPSQVSEALSVPAQADTPGTLQGIDMRDDGSYEVGLSIHSVERAPLEPVMSPLIAVVDYPTEEAQFVAYGIEDSHILEYSEMPCAVSPI